MPFGGHQQVLKSTTLSHIPYFHLLPTRAYTKVLRLFNASPKEVEMMLRNKRTGLNTRQFDQVLKKTGYQVLERQLYLTNPIYEYRFGLPPLRQLSAVGRLPYVRDVLSTCAYYLVRAPSEATQ